MSQPALCRILQRERITRKKTKRTAEQERKDLNAGRQAFEGEMAALQAEDIMAVDDMGGVTGLVVPLALPPVANERSPLSLLKTALDSA